MSFSNDVKNEIIQNKPVRLRYKHAQAYGLFLFAREFSAEAVSLHTESADIAELYGWFAYSLCGRQTTVITREKSRRGRPFYEVCLPLRADRERLLAALRHSGDGICPAMLDTPESIHAFLSGAWLTCGNITDPQKGYHLEFVCRSAALCEQLAALLDECLGEVTRRTTRRGIPVLYFKECALIEDLLTMMGASKSSLAMIEVEIIKNVRNRANRATNCETANLDKLVTASTNQAADIRYILDVKGMDWLPEPLRQIARLRLDNPEMSLRELSELSPAAISRSGVHHRLDKLSKLAQALREQERGERDV